jgi:asparagine synthase (glutamine-hydrolysing)
MMAALEHRGPDDSGEFRDQDVHLGFMRLAIIDLKSGNQPVHGCGQGFVTAFNGEIYNYQDLRAQLRESGHGLRADGDAEVIPHLFEEQGLGAVQSLTGMFSIATWDSSNRHLHLIRDRLGIKPLYWAKTKDYLLFASEIKAIFRTGLVAPEIDPNALDDVFSLSYPCPPRTMFKEVFALRPARTLTASAGRRETVEKRYWEAPVPRLGEHTDLSRSDAADHLRELLKQVTYDHLQADVPLACYLSGGLDSSAIAGLAKEVTGDAPR